jgi:hypothetical protein
MDSNGEHSACLRSPATDWKGQFHNLSFIDILRSMISGGAACCAHAVRGNVFEVRSLLIFGIYVCRMFTGTANRILGPTLDFRTPHSHSYLYWCTYNLHVLISLMTFLTLKCSHYSLHICNSKFARDLFHRNRVDLSIFRNNHISLDHHLIKHG